MARIKYYNPETGKWEYADSQYNVGSGGNVDQESQIAMLIEVDMLPAVYDTNGAILTDENGNIILRY